jgi:hypothetical protein
MRQLYVSKNVKSVPKYQFMNNILSTAACSLWLQCSAERTRSALEENTAVCGWPSCVVCSALLCSASLYTTFLTMSQNLNTLINTVKNK